MKTHLLWILALTGCTHVYLNPSGEDIAEVGFTTRIARSPYQHKTAIAVRDDPDASWARVRDRDEIRLDPGTQHFRFEGIWYEEPAPHHHHYYGSTCLGCTYSPSNNTAVDAAFVIIGAAIAAAVIAEEIEYHRQEVVSVCAVEVALEVAPEDDIELTFRHDDQDRCDVVCSRYDDSGRKPCRILQSVASR